MINYKVNYEIEKAHAGDSGYNIRASQLPYD